MRPNYNEFYNKVFDKVRLNIHHFPKVKYPRKVTRFEDKVVRIKTIEPLSILIRVPFKEVTRVMNTFWKDYNAFAEFLYTYVPLLTTYTTK